MLGRVSALGQIEGKSRTKPAKCGGSMSRQGRQLLEAPHPRKIVIKVAERASSSRREIVKGKDLTPTFFRGAPGAAYRLTDPRVGGQLEEVQFLFCRLKGRITDHVTCSKIDEGLPLRVN
jgi:hypothetical protein